jgi:hypothetical protein
MSLNFESCKNCDALDYHWQTPMLALVTVQDDGRVNLGRTFDVRAMACKNCGHLTLFSAALYKPLP